MQTGIPTVKLERLKVFSCRDCDKVYTSEDRLSDHSQWHDLMDYLEIPQVADHFDSAHVKLQRVTIFRCGVCSAAFNEIRRFKNHQATAHKKQKTKQSSQHSTIDEGNNNELEKPYKCVECGWRFVAKATLKAHGAVHGPMHTCFCGVAFYQQRDLLAHRRLVHPTNLTWKQETKYKGPKPKSEFATVLDPESDQSDSDHAPRKSIKPRLRAELVIKRKTKKKQKWKVNKGKRKINKENICGPPYQCRECPKNFLKLSTYKTHLNIHTDRAVKCPDCDKVFPYKHKLEAHSVVHSGKKPHMCKICKKGFTQLAALNTHLKSVHVNAKEFKCNICEKGFNLKNQLQRHQVIHTGLKPYVCPFKTCEKGFSDQSALGRHIRTHTGELKYFCEHCPAAYTDYSAKVRHVDSHHLKNKYECKFCCKLLTSPHNLNIHMRTHHGIGEQQQFECDYCGKTFKLKQYLVMHMDFRHKDRQRTLQCDFCPKTFKHPATREAHVSRDHLLKYAFKCDYCNMIFVTKPNLISHIKYNHTGTPKKYQCDHCHKRFIRKKYISLHIVRDHLNLMCVQCKHVNFTPLELKKHKCFFCTECKRYFGTKLKLEFHKKKERPVKVLNGISNGIKVINSDTKEISNNRNSINSDEMEILNDSNSINSDKMENLNKNYINLDEMEISNNRNSIYLDNKEISNGKNSINSYEMAILNDRNSVNSDKTEILNDRDSVNSDKTEIRDGNSINSDKMEISNDKHYINSDEMEI